jgi:integrase
MSCPLDSKPFERAGALEPATPGARAAALKSKGTRRQDRPRETTSPAAAARGPRHIVRRGKTPVLDPAEARQLIDAINTSTIGLRDRALIGLMVYSFARIGAAISMRVEDVYPQNRRLWVRLHEKGGKQHAMPCHHNLETYLHEYLDGAGLRALAADDPDFFTA